MGVEFLQNVGKPIKIARDRDLMELASKDLFTRSLDLPKRYEVLKLEPGVVIDPGDELNLELNGDEIVAVAGERIVGRLEVPMRAVVELIQEFGVIAGRVDEVHEGARVADVEILE